MTGSTRWVLSIVSLVSYVFTKVSVTVYAGAVVFRAQARLFSNS